MSIVESNWFRGNVAIVVRLKELWQLHVAQIAMHDEEMKTEAAGRVFT